MSKTDTQLRELILSFVPDDGSTVGNARLLKQLFAHPGPYNYERVRDGLIKEGVQGKGVKLKSCVWREVERVAYPAD